jgi:hypothetical protein
MKCGIISEDEPCLTWNGFQAKCPEELMKRDPNNKYYWNFFLHRMHNRIASEFLKRVTGVNLKDPLHADIAAVETEYVAKVVNMLFENSRSGKVGDNSGRWFFGTEMAITFEAKINQIAFSIADHTYWFPDVIANLDAEGNSCNAYRYGEDGRAEFGRNAACSIDFGDLPRVWGNPLIIRRRLVNTLGENPKSLSDAELARALEIAETNAKDITNDERAWWVYESPSNMAWKSTERLKWGVISRTVLDDVDVSNNRVGGVRANKTLKKIRFDRALEEAEKRLASCTRIMKESGSIHQKRIGALEEEIKRKTQLEADATRLATEAEGGRKEAEDRLASCTSDTGGLKATIREAETRALEKEDEVIKLNKDLEERGKELTQTREELNQITTNCLASRQEAEDRLASCTRETGGLKASLTQAETRALEKEDEVIKLNKALEERGKELTQTREEAETLLAEAKNEIDKLVSEKNAEALGSSKQMESTREYLVTSRSHVNKKAAELYDCRDRLADLKATITEAETRALEKEDEVIKLNKTLEESGKELTQTREEKTTLRADIVRLEAAESGWMKRASELEAALLEATKKIDKLESEKNAENILQSENEREALKSLKQMVSTREYVVTSRSHVKKKAAELYDCRDRLADLKAALDSSEAAASALDGASRDPGNNAQPDPADQGKGKAHVSVDPFDSSIPRSIQKEERINFTTYDANSNQGTPERTQRSTRNIHSLNARTAASTVSGDSPEGQNAIYSPEAAARALDGASRDPGNIAKPDPANQGSTDAHVSVDPFDSLTMREIWYETRENTTKDYAKPALFTPLPLQKDSPPMNLGEKGGVESSNVRISPPRFGSEQKLDKSIGVSTFSLLEFQGAQHLDDAVDAALSTHIGDHDVYTLDNSSSVDPITVTHSLSGTKYRCGYPCYLAEFKGIGIDGLPILDTPRVLRSGDEF